MKPFQFAPLLGFLCLPLFAAEVDPRVLEVMRKEQITAQSFCFSFAQGGLRNGRNVAEKCTSFAAGRYFGNMKIAEKMPKTELGGGIIFHAHDEFCAEVGKFTQPGDSVRDNCDTWNRSRMELFELGTTDGAPASQISAKIDEVEGDHRRFCQSLRNAGDPGDGSIFRSRIAQCFALVKLSTASDRAIFLGDF